MYRPLWSEQILAEMAKALKTKLHRSTEAAAWRRQQMKQAFPEAMVTVPSALLKATPGIFRKIVARNTTSSAKRRMIFLVDQYRFYPQLVLDKLDDQAAGISQSRDFVVASLKASVPKFSKLV